MSHERFAADLAQVGNREALQQWRLQYPSWGWDAEVCAGAALGGHGDLLQWLRSLDPPCPWSSSTPAMAARGGHLHLLIWLKQQQCPWDDTVWCEAVKHHHTEVVEWLKQNATPPRDYSGVLYVAAEAGDLALLQWLWLKPQCLTFLGNRMLCVYAARGGQIPVLQWARQQGCAWDESVSGWAAYAGQTETLQWLRAQSPPCPWVETDVCTRAFQQKQWTTLQWLLEEQCCVPSWLSKRCNPAPWPWVKRAKPSSHFLFRQRLATHHGIVWDEPTMRWFHAIDEVGCCLLAPQLCSDLVHLIHRYV